MFKDRQEAGELLAQKLRKIIKGEDFVTVTLLRGGIVLGKRISDYYGIPLLPLSVKKIGAPLNPELAIGAVTFDKTSYFDKDLIGHLRVDEDYIERLLEIKSKEALILHQQFKDKISLKDKKVIIVDDGIATGTTAICASIYTRKQGAKRIILATPVIGKDTFTNIKKYFDRVVFLKIVDNFMSVSQFYKNFPQITDRDVLNFLL